jgi:hypothetical protein
MNKEILLSNTKIAKDLVKDVLNINQTEQPAEAVGSRPQILSDEFLALVDGTYAALQQSGRLAQQFPMPLPAD